MSVSGDISNDKLFYLLQNCRAGDTLNQKQVYNLFLSYCSRVCALYIKNNNEIAEVVNDGFVKIFKQLHRFDFASEEPLFAFKAWVKKIMINTAIDHLRKYKRHLIVSPVAPELFIVPCYENAVDRLSYKEVVKAISMLSPGYREVLKLYVLNGCSHPEIASLLDITVSSSKSNLFRGRKQLKKILLLQS